MTHQSPYSGLRQVPRIDLPTAIPLAGPLSVYLELTNICNFKCVFCPESFVDYSDRAGGLFRMSDRDIERACNELRAIGTAKTLNFYMMGEPFAHKGLTAAISLARRSNAAERLIVTSNGTLLTPKVHQELIDSGLDFLRISIYGGTEETHRQRTQNSTPLEKIRNNIAAFREYRDSRSAQKPFIYVKMIDSGNPEENQSFRDYFSGVADELMIEPVMNWNDPTEGNLAGLPQEQLLQTPYFANKKRACPFPFYTVVIHSDLQVSVCCVDWSKQLVIGNLSTQSLRDIWQGDALREIQERHLAGRRDTLDGCRTCTYLHTAPDNLDALTVEEFRNRRRPDQGASNA